VDQFPNNKYAERLQVPDGPEYLIPEDLHGVIKMDPGQIYNVRNKLNKFENQVKKKNTKSLY